VHPDVFHYHGALLLFELLLGEDTLLHILWARNTRFELLSNYVCSLSWIWS